MKRAIVLFLFILALGGCASASLDPAGARALWAQQQGGEVTDSRLTRITTIGTAFLAHSAMPLTFHVLRTTAVTAYSWDSGDIYLSGGLVDVATDDEIAAAIAHEMGHMLAAKNNPASLGGPSLDIERRADAAGITLLAKTSHPRAALVSMLSKVGAAGGEAVLQSEIRERIKSIQALIAAR